MERLPAVLALSELARYRLGDGMDYRPIRKAMGVSAFGINAYTADEGTVIEPHDELGSGSGGHEELYFVATGHAKFEVDGEEIDAPPGTIVFVQPEQHRSATAHAPDTTVLVIGGKPGAAGPPSPFEYWYLAIGEAAGEGVRDRGRGPRALPRERGSAVQPRLLRGAGRAPRGRPAPHQDRVRVEPKAREWAKDDSDLDSIRADL